MGRGKAGGTLTAFDLPRLSLVVPVDAADFVVKLRHVAGGGGKREGVRGINSGLVGDRRGLKGTNEGLEGDNTGFGGTEGGSE